MATTGMPRRLASRIAIASLLVSMTNIRSEGRAHVLDAAERLVQLLAFAVEVQAFLLGPGPGPHPPEARPAKLAQALDRIGDLVFQLVSMPPSRQGDVVLGRTLGSIGDDVESLALGADEQDAAATGNGVGNLLQRLVQQRNQVCDKIDDQRMLLRAP